MDIDLIRAKEDSIVRCIQRIRTKAVLSQQELTHINVSIGKSSTAS